MHIPSDAILLLSCSALLGRGTLRIRGVALRKAAPKTARQRKVRMKVGEKNLSTCSMNVPSSIRIFSSHSPKGPSGLGAGRVWRVLGKSTGALSSKGIAMEQAYKRKLELERNGLEQ